MSWREAVRTVEDWPQPGVNFLDLNPCFDNPELMGEIMLELERAVPPGVTHFAGIEARGLALAAILANRLYAGFIPIRKAGKLPPPTLRLPYKLEYGEAELEIPHIYHPRQVVLVDDVLATGGTAEAAVGLLRRSGAVVLGGLFVLSVDGLGGSALLGSLGVPHTVLGDRC